MFLEKRERDEREIRESVSPRPGQGRQKKAKGVEGRGGEEGRT